MSATFAVLKDRWYLVVGGLLGLWLLFRLLGGHASSASATLPSGVSVQYAGTTANDAAVQVAGAQTQGQIASQQIAMAQAINIAEIAYKATKDTNATNVQLAETQGHYALAITNSNNEAAGHASDNATTLGIVQSGDATRRDIALSDNNTKVAIVNSDNARLLGIDTNATNLKKLENINSTQLAAYTIQGTVAQKQIQAYEDIATRLSDNTTAVQTKAITATQELEAAKIAQQNQVIADTYDLTRYGVFNKGGAGGTNQVAVWNAVLNPASAATGDMAAAGVATAQTRTLADVLNGLSNVFSSVGKSAGVIFG